MCAGSNPAGGTRKDFVSGDTQSDAVERGFVRIKDVILCLIPLAFDGPIDAPNDTHLVLFSGPSGTPACARGSGNYGTIIMRTVSVTWAPPEVEPAMMTIGSPDWAIPAFFTWAMATSQSSSMSWAGEMTTWSTPHEPRS
jgi:hypothetical protein